MRPLATIFAISAFNLLASADAALFEDHFDGGTMSPEWVSMRPQQWVQDGWLHTQSDGSVPGRNSDAIVHDGDPTWTDYTFSLTVDPLLTSTWERAFVYCRMNNTILAPNGIWFDGYVLDFIGPADNIGSHLGFVRVYTDGTSNQLFHVDGIPATSEPWEVVINATGSRFRVWLDGDLLVDVVDPDPVLHGGIGIGAIWEAEARFDDVVVIPEPATLCLLCLGGLLIRNR